MNQVTASFWAPPKSIEVLHLASCMPLKQGGSCENCFVYQVKARLALVCGNPRGLVRWARQPIS